MNKNRNHNDNRRRLGRTVGFGGPTGKINSSSTRSEQDEGFYYYGSKKKEQSSIYKLAVLFLFIPLIVLFLLGNNFYWQGIVIAILGMILLIFYLYRLLTS